MKHRIRIRFWFELVAGIIFAILCVIALVNRLYVGLIFALINSDWILEIDTLAWWVVGVLLVLAILFLGLAAFEWRRHRVLVAKTEL